MATQFATAPAQSGSRPFLFARPHVEEAPHAFSPALSAAVAAERLREKRSSCSRVAFLLCELGVQLARRGMHKDQLLPVSRAELADALGTSLTRVKRTLGLFTLSGVVVSTGDGIRILDWRRLCSVANYDAGRLGLSSDEPRLRDEQDEQPLKLTTAAGDPACFV